ncbi:MAG TPA: hypothetical protein VF538_06060 [Pyrinomonadaceae bacterium]|jgi:hypothetical protein
MLNRLTSPFGRIFTACITLCLFCFTPRGVGAQGPRAPSARAAAGEAARISLEDGLSLAGRVKAVESPALRAYLYDSVASWLWRGAGRDEGLRQAAADTAAAGLADIHRHEGELPPVVASNYYARLLAVVRQYKPEEAERLRQALPVRQQREATDQDRAAGDFYSAKAKLSDPRTAAQGLAQAVDLLASGRVRIESVFGALLQLDAANSPALPQLLSAALSFEERRRGAIPLAQMHFLSSMFLKDGMPPELQIRFLNDAATRAAQLTPAELADPVTRSQAVTLLRRILPFLQKQSPALYAEAAAKLAAVAPGLPPEDPVYSRIRNSPDQLAQTIDEANSAGDERLKGDLLASAARLAKAQGKLRQAVELITTKEEDRRGLSEGYSPRDDFLSGVLSDALGLKDVDVARSAAAGMTLDVNRADALRRIARHFAEAKDPVSAADTLNEAAKTLKDAPDDKEKASAYLRLASEFSGLDDARARDMIREAATCANRIPRPSDDPHGEFAWRLFPLADDVTRTFQQLARRDRDGTLNLADSFRAKEFSLAATIGVYRSAEAGQQVKMR